MSRLFLGLWHCISKSLLHRFSSTLLPLMLGCRMARLFYFDVTLLSSLTLHLILRCNNIHLAQAFCAPLALTFNCSLILSFCLFLTFVLYFHVAVPSYVSLALLFKFFIALTTKLTLTLFITFNFHLFVTLMSKLTLSLFLTLML